MSELIVEKEKADKINQAMKNCIVSLNDEIRTPVKMIEDSALRLINSLDGNTDFLSLASGWMKVHKPVEMEFYVIDPGTGIPESVRNHISACFNQTINIFNDDFKGIC